MKRNNEDTIFPLLFILLFLAIALMLNNCLGGKDTSGTSNFLGKFVTEDIFFEI